MFGKTAESRCHSGCQYFRLARANGSAILQCGVLPQKFEVTPAPDDAPSFFNKMEQQEHIVMPIACQAVSPTLSDFPTRDLYRRK